MNPSELLPEGVQIMEDGFEPNFDPSTEGLTHYNHCVINY